MKKIINQYSGFSKSIYALFVAMLVTNMGGFIWPLLTLILADKMGYEEKEIGILIFLLALLVLPFSFIGGKLADRFSKKWVIVAFDIVTFSSYIVCSFLESSNTMLVFLVIAALFAVMELPAFSALIMELSPTEDRERVFSFLYLGRNLGIMVSGAVGGLLYANYLNLAFMIDGLTTIASTILIIIFVSSKIKPEKIGENRNVYEDKVDSKKSSIALIFENKTILIYLLICALSSIVYSQWAFILPLFLDNLYGASEGGAAFFGVLSSVNGLTVIVSTPVITYLFRKHKEYYKIILGIFLYSASFLLLMFETKFMIMIMLIVFTIGEVMHTVGAKPYISKRVPASHRGRLSSYENIAYSVGYAVSNLIIGWLLAIWSYNNVFFILFSIGVIVVIISYFNYYYDKRTYPKLHE